jgi:ATP-binding cassette subfamily B protein
VKPLARLSRFYWKYKHLFVPGLLCAIASAGFAILVPMVVRQAVDRIPGFVRAYRGLGETAAAGELSADYFYTLVGFCLVIIALSIASGLFSFLMRQTIVVASRHIEFDLRNELYEHLQRLSQRFYVERSTGDIITRATSDIEQVRRYVGPAIMYLTRALVIVVTALAAMIIISPQLTMYAVIPMPFLGIAVFLVARLVHSRSDRLQKQYSSLTSRVQEALSGIRVVKAYTRESSEREAFRAESDTYRKRMLDLALVEAAFRPVFILLIGLSTIIVVWVGGRLVIEGAITIGNIAEYIIYVALMTWPVAAMGFVITMIQRASASMIRLNDIMDSVPAIADGPQTNTSITTVRGDVSFVNVCFRFDADGPWVLDDISFDIRAGQTCAIIGRTGSGKSTIVSMIPRMLEPTSGEVRVDGVDIRHIPVDVLRNSVGFVPQEVFLFSESVGGNIAFGKRDSTSDEIERAAFRAELLENVSEFQSGFETLVGERGISVSGGQKQRTSIARAMIREPRILALDDALSAVDTETERAILQKLKDFAGDRTLFIVSHRVSAVQDADLILVLDEGRIVERGTHAALIRRAGLYASLYKKQLLEQEIASIG